MPEFVAVAELGWTDIPAIVLLAALVLLRKKRLMENLEAARRNERVVFPRH